MNVVKTNHLMVVALEKINPAGYRNINHLLPTC